MDASEDRNYEDFVRLFTHHEPKLRAFVRSLLPTWEDVDEVMQETSLVLWRKWSEFDPSTDFMKWGCVVARFEVLKHRRRKARDRHVFDPDLIEILAAEGADEVEALDARRKALDSCLQQLPENQRRLVMAAYAPGRTIKEIAAQAGKSATALYKTLNRVRTALLECVERSTRKEGLA
ncbi:MAG: sigma-70 family RNA polymerase sigma factor [Akkermansiaceae bacterium]|nr:sigma-70 family RNA polymerase sigma factor [Akkermansiaceae bacterium]NNM29006.1 sigma-70 family RNA polymerase sigma factor [Akkermansiaceae bacterium]